LSSLIPSEIPGFPFPLREVNWQRNFRSKLRRRGGQLTSVAWLIGALVLSAAVTANAQVPAGPNRPPQVPEDYVITPFGYFHPSCVIRLAEGEELLEGGDAVQKADGTIYRVQACQYPRYTARGAMVRDSSTTNPPTIGHSWIVGVDVTSDSSFGEIDGTWSVPSAPQSYHGQTIYLFPGLEDYVQDTSILQPVLVSCPRNT
jgi:hypothetical protein